MRVIPTDRGVTIDRTERQFDFVAASESEMPEWYHERLQDAFSRMDKREQEDYVLKQAGEAEPVVDFFPMVHKETKTCDELISELSSKFDSLSHNSQYWIGLAGAPGSGKSTVTQRIKEVLGEKVVVIPMDGYHYSRSELDAMDDPKEAHERRGAPFTFNSRKLVDDLSRAHRSGFGCFPGFDHSKGDPEERSVSLGAGKKIVIVEGNYLLLSESPWDVLQRDVFDEGWFLYVPLEECKRRVLKRHQEVMKMTKEEAMRRVVTNDGPNVELVARESIENADRIIEIR